MKSVEEDDDIVAVSAKMEIFWGKLFCLALNF